MTAEEREETISSIKKNTIKVSASDQKDTESTSTLQFSGIEVIDTEEKVAEQATGLDAAVERLKGLGVDTAEIGLESGSEEFVEDLQLSKELDTKGFDIFEFKLESLESVSLDGDIDTSFRDIDPDRDITW